MALPGKILQNLLTTTLLIAVGAGCLRNVPKPGLSPDPDINSGPDANRSGAKLMHTNRAETESVSWPRLLRTKWKRIEISNPGVQNILECELRIDNTGADVNLDIFNSLGTQIGFSPGPSPNKLKKLGVQIDELGTYFIRVQAAQPRDQSDLSVLCLWEEQAVPTAPPKLAAQLPRRHGGGRGPILEATNGTEGRIVQFYREGDKTILFLDKGSDAGVREGTAGIVLLGKSGRQRLAGGDFHVSRVISGSRSIAESSVKSIGRDNRMLLFMR